MTLIDISPRQIEPSWSMVCVAACLGLFGGLVFAAFPQIDLAVSRLFYLGDHKFLFGAVSSGLLRELFRLIFILACIGAVIGFAVIAFASRRLFKLGFAAWLYVLLCAAVGPGLVANLVFKDHWGRARPIQTTEFGGTKQFTAVLTRSDQCERNCSFISGEASNLFAIGFAIALLAERARRRSLFLAVIGAGTLAGIIRIGGGAHFVSDVFFAGVFMAFVARGLYWLLFERFAPVFADEGPLHRRTLYAGQRGAEQAARLMVRARELRRQGGDGGRVTAARLMERAQELRRQGGDRARVTAARLMERARKLRQSSKGPES
jgi:lipid A 4'-phosphatase